VEDLSVVHNVPSHAVNRIQDRVEVDLTFLHFVQDDVADTLARTYFVEPGDVEYAKTDLATLDFDRG